MTPVSLLPIVNFGTSLEEFRHTALDEALIAVLRGAFRKCSKAYLHDTVPIKLFECVAQLLGEKVTGEPLSVNSFWKTSVAYVGAINSGKFINAPLTWRHRHSTAFRVALDHLLNDGLFVPPLTYTPQVRALDPSLVPFVEHFESLNLDADAAWLWHGWWSRNEEGILCNFPLHGVYARLGRPFTEKLYKVLDTSFSKGRTRYLTFVRPIAEALEHFPGVSEDTLLDEKFANEFWSYCVENFVVTRDAKGNDLSTTLHSWHTNGKKLISEVLQPSGLFAIPSGGLPSLPSRTKSGESTNIKQSSEGVEVKVRLLTEVPINETDQAALQQVFFEIGKDVELIETWASAEFQKFTEAVDARKELAIRGTPRIIGQKGTNSGGRRALTARDNPNALNNAAATFEYHGYLTMAECDIGLLYPRPLIETALQLGIPVSGALLPHLALLIIDHPVITPSFLEKLNLYDQSGKMTGFVSTDAGRYLRSKKDRARTTQDVLLTERGIHVVEAIISATQPLRDYLKARNEPAWRHLLLSSGKSFGHPVKINSISGLTVAPGILEKYSKQLIYSTGISIEQATDLMRRFSLPRLRASRGVLIYIETGSLEAMSSALGHSAPDPKLLEHYLPRVILQFFQERWIRTFQAGMITYAMRDSGLLLEASSLNSSTKLNEFINKHAFKSLEELGDHQQSSDKKVFISVDENILAVLLQVVEDVKDSDSPVTVQARFWCTFAQKLFAYIEDDKNKQEDLQAALTKARSMPRNFSFKSLVLR